jgi:hypothetical protein
MLWERKPANLTDKSSVIQFISTFFNQIKGNLFENRPTKPIPNEVVCVSKVFASQDWMNWVKDENYRRELVLRGETFANVFLSYRRNFRESRQAPTQAPTTPVLQAITVPVEIPDEEVSSQQPNTETEKNENENENNNDDDITMM